MQLAHAWRRCCGAGARGLVAAAQEATAARRQLDTARCRDRMQPTERFYSDVLRFGSLRGFRHFSTTLRGREELLIYIHACDTDRLTAHLAAARR